MRLRTLASMTVVFGMALASAPGLFAQDIRNDRRDLHRDYERVERLRRKVARDQWRLDRDYRYGNRWAADRDARELARDQAALDYQLRDIRHDRRDLNRDYQGYR